MDRTDSFGYWLRRRRKALDLTQAELAQRASCSLNLIQKIEADARRPSRRVAELLADALALDPAERAAFLQAARAELAVDRLPASPLPTSRLPAGAPVSAAEPMAQTSLPSTAAPSVRCPACGAAVVTDGRFCAQCGAAIRQVCLACGVENPIGTRFCGACGAMQEVAAPSTALSTAERAATTPREERRWVTVLFADISEFTAMAERLDPEEVKALVARCVEQIGVQIHRFGGTIVNVIGDAVLAVFGAPLAHEDDATRAVRAALALRDSSLSNDPKQPLTLHIGINTGEVLATMHGPPERRDYTVLGDTVNTARRILEAAPAGHVLIGEETYRATRHAVQYRELSPVVAKGKQHPIRLWEALTVTLTPEARPLGVAPLIGRDEELDRLLRMWTRVARAAQPHLVTLLGEPGIGKSRLVAEFERRLPADVTVWHGRCLPYGEALSYWAVALALKEAAGISAEDEAETARAKLGNLVAGVIGAERDSLEIAQHLALLSGLDLEADRVRGDSDERILHASARRFLEAYARQHALCLIVDDLHWADTALLDLIESIATRMRDAPLLIVTLARPELLEQRATWGRGVRSFTSLPVEALGESAEHELVVALCQERDLPVELAVQIGHRPGGNPLFVEELVAMIAESGHAVGIPSAIKTLLAARLDILPAEERTVLQLAAVFGKVFWEGGLRALDGRIVGSVTNLLEGLGQKDLLRPLAQSQFRGDREYSFKHDLIRDAAYEILPRAERRVLHGHAIDWLEGAASDQVENYYDQLAHHAVQAGQPERALGYLMRAAERASHAAAHRQAAALLDQAITITKGLAQPDLLADLHTRRGKAFIGVGMWDDVRRELEAALATLEPERLEQRAQILLDLGIVNFWLLDMPSLRRASTEALALAEAASRDDLAAAAIANLSSAEGADGNLQECEALYERALGRGGEVAVSHSPSHARFGLTFYWRGRFSDAVPLARKAVVFAQDDTYNTIYTLPHLGLAFAGSGQYIEAERVFDEARSFGRKYEIWPLLARAFAMSAGFHLDLFDFAGNEVLVEEARELGRSVNFLPPVVSASLDLLLNLARRQEVGRAEKLVDEIAAVADKAAGFHGWLWRLRLAEARAELALARGDWEETLRLAEDAIGQSRARGRVKYHAFGLETRAGALAALGRTREAIADLRSAVELTRPTDDPAMFLRAAAGLLKLAGDDALLAEARAAAQRIAAALPNDEMRHRFEVAEPVRLLGRLRS